MSKNTNINKEFFDFVKQKDAEVGDYSQLIDNLVGFLETKEVSIDDINKKIIKIKQKRLSERVPKDIPVSVFSNVGLSSFEAICKYLKEDKGLKFSEIAKLTNRDQRTVWVSYDKARKKHPSRILVEDSKYKIPVRAIADRKLSVLETISHHLHAHYNLKFHQIAGLLKLDDRTIWTVVNRAVKKLENAKR